MNTLATVLRTPAANGLYRLDWQQSLTDLQHFAAASKTNLVVLPGKTIQSKADLLDACATALAFPNYFGHNWDALADCLMDLSWLPAQGQLILYDHPAALIQHAPATWATAAAIFTQAAHYWRDHNRRFSVLLCHSAGTALSVPLLRA
jgi:RNAse (barnase) inhibitor barstar